MAEYGAASLGGFVGLGLNDRLSATEHQLKETRHEQKTI
jgi:hypothetical protein